VGTVTDTTGAVIPGAKVVVTNPEKGFVRQLESNSVGDYTAAKVPIGSYVVMAEAHGFQKLVRSGITLEVGQTLRVDLKLAVGQVSQEVTVTGSTVKVETENGTISNVVTGKQITSLELNGRNFTSLYTLVPGAVQDDSYDPTQIGITGFAAISFNGNRMEYNNLEIDGGNNVDEGSGGVSINTYPSLDSIAEFRVSTSNYGADMGKHAGASIEVATKSGTRDFHGTVFEFFRNDHLDANDWFANRQLWSGLDPTADCKADPAVAGATAACNAPKTPLLWNDYGYNIGGPIFIPRHFNTDKSKLFFFWSQNWRAYRQGTVISNGVPSQLMRQGNFSECDQSSPNYNAVVASGCVLPMTPPTSTSPGIPYPNDTVPIDPNAQTLLNGLVPLPNNGPVGYIAAPNVPTNWREELIRVDANISSKAQLFVRYTQDTWNTVAIPSLWTSSVYDTVQTPFLGPAKSTVLNFAYNFKPNLVNEFVVAYTADHISLGNQTGASSPSGSIDKPSNWTGTYLFPANATNPLLPAVSVSGGLPFGFTEDAGNRPWTNANPIITMKDNVIYSRGKHSLKMGFFFENYRKNEQFGFDTQGFLTFSNGSTLTTGNALADMYLGAIGQYQEGAQTVNGVAVGGYPRGHWRSNDFEPYIQDDWKVTRKLTLNLGLRYYYFQPIHDVSQPQTVDSGFFPNLYNPALQTQLDSNGNLIPGSGYNYTTYGNGLVECGHGGIAAGCRQPNYATLAPRFGFAYDPTGSGKTSIRGGYGIYFENGNGNESNTEGGEGNPPVSLSPSGYNIVGYSGIVAGALGPTGFVGIPYQEKWGSVQQFNLGVEHEFPGNNILEVSYVGSLGRHLGTQRNLDQVPVGIGTVNVPSLAADNNPQGCDSSGNCNVQSVLINNELGTNVFFVPYLGYSAINVKQNSAVSAYNALQVNFRHPFGHGLTFQAAYTWSHNIDNSTTTYFSTSVDDNYDLSRWRGTSDLNRTHVLVMNYVYDLPFFKNASHAFVKGALGGWQISGITSFFSGEPVEATNTNFGCSNVVNPVTGNTYGTGIGGSVRCNTVGPLKIFKGVNNDPQFGPTPSWYDPNVVTEPTLAQMAANGQPGMFGYMGRNVLTGPGRNNWDIALLKNFQLPWFHSEHSTLQFRWETFNTFNHPQWKSINAGCSGAPNNDGTAAFGRPCGGNTYNLGIGEVSGAWAPRIMQFSLKFLF
jgi:hypothetical protein